MSKRRSTRPSLGSQPKKLSSDIAFNTKPFTKPAKPPKVNKLRRARDKFLEGVFGRESSVDPVKQMPGVMGQPARGRGYIPFSGGPKVKKGDRVGPPEDVIRKANQPNTAGNSSNTQNNNQTRRGKKNQRVKGDYSNPADFIKPSDLLTPIIGQPRELPGPKEPSGPVDTRYGPFDTRTPSKRRPMKPVPVVPPVPLLPEEEGAIEQPRISNDDGEVGVFYFEKGRFLTRGKRNGKASRTTQRRR